MPRVTDRPQYKRSALFALASFCLATVLLIPLERYLLGSAFWLLSWAFVFASRDPKLLRYLGVLLGACMLLAFAPIHTDLSTNHFISLGIPFALAILGPYSLLKWLGTEGADWRFWPRQWVWRDVGYTLLSIPLSWAIIEIYFFHLNPDLAANWPLAHPRDEDVVRRFVIGINCVGIWDELFFVNTVYALMRKVYPAKIANPAQAVFYTSVLWDMAFRGWGPIIVYGFALTQGVMFEKSRVLLWVLLVHLIVDAFLVIAVLRYHYPGQPLGVF